MPAPRVPGLERLPADRPAEIAGEHWPSPNRKDSGFLACLLKRSAISGREDAVLTRSLEGWVDGDKASPVQAEPTVLEPRWS